ncbi:MAG: cysteine hydrolase [Acidobacteria bacterium]|nr:cysteine hydrolase [Acidobacteriota bacterium]
MAAGTVFWDVDTQVDFLHPDGKLYVPGAERILPNLQRLTAWAHKNRILIVASADAHQKGDEEFKLYPPHCLAGTPGQKKVPETLLWNQAVLPNRPAELPADLETVGQVILEKQKFDVFTNPNTEALLGRLGKDVEIVLYGVVTEICVAAAARGLLERGYRLRLVRDAVHHLEGPKARALFEEVEEGGGRLVTTDEACSNPKR